MKQLSRTEFTVNYYEPEEALEILRKDPDTVHLVITDFLMTGIKNPPIGVILARR